MAEKNRKAPIPEEWLGVLHGKSSEELLRNLLDNCLSGADTAAVAKGLLARFETFAGVINSPVRELLKVSGMTTEAAGFISSMPDFFRQYMEDMQSNLMRVYSTELAYKLIRNKFVGRKTEIIVLMILNSRGQVVYNNIVSEGSITIVPIYVKNIIQLCLEYNADTVILAHNHPSGNPSPSKGDVVATKEVQMALESIYINLYDHMIFTDTDYFSMRGSGWLSNVIASSEKFRKDLLAEALALEEDLMARNRIIPREGTDPEGEL